MRLSSYWKFKEYGFINENVAQAKKLARELYQVNKIITKLEPGKYKTNPDGLVLWDSDGYPIPPKDMDQDIVQKAKNILQTDPVNLKPSEKIDFKDEEIQKAEKANIIEDVKTLVGKKQGYVYMFLYFHLVEQVPLEELKSLIKDLDSNGDLLQRLRRNITNYIDTDVPNNFEQLVDDIQNIERYRKSKKFINEFPTNIKKEYDEALPYLKDKLVGVATAFDELGKENGVIDKAKQKAIQKRFFQKIKAYPNLSEIIKGAENFIKAESNGAYSKFIEAIYKTKQYGVDHSAELLYDENEVILFEVRSYGACQDLCGSTSWCIARYLNHWQDYVGGDTVYNKQYVVVNFNLSPTDPNGFIGVTIKPHQEVRAAHDRDDGNIAYEFKRTLKEFEREYLGNSVDLFEMMKPMTPEEIDRKKRCVSANRNIVKKDITLEELTQYHSEDGADINADKGAPLDNAVAEDSIEKVEYLLTNRALTTMRKEFEATVNKVQSFPVLKLLLNHGAELTPSAFRPMLNDIEAVRFCLENGMDPNLQGGMPLRQAIKRGNMDMVVLLLNSGADIGKEDGKTIKIALEQDQPDIAKYLLDNGFNKNITAAFDWMGIAKARLTPEKRLEYLRLLQSWVDDGLATWNDTPVRVEVGDGSWVNMGYEEICKKWGNYSNYIIDKYEALRDIA